MNKILQQCLFGFYILVIIVLIEEYFRCYDKFISNVNLPVAAKFAVQKGVLRLNEKHISGLTAVGIRFFVAFIIIYEKNM